jgi:hypothetical protein
MSLAITIGTGIALGLVVGVVGILAEAPVWETTTILFVSYVTGYMVGRFG